MENASKALIIAGAILLAILIISLGILVYNQASDTVDQANLDSQELQTFNAQFTDYEGSNKSSATVRSLISLVNSSNAAEESSARGLYVYINGDDSRSSGNPGVQTMEVSDTSTYTITLVYATDGAVCNIEIS